MESIFSSIGLSLSTSVFILIVGIVYYIKNKSSEAKVSNKTFVLLLILTMLLGGVELAVTILLSKSTEPTSLNDLMCRIMIFMGFLWNLIYVIYVRKLTKESQNKDSKLKIVDWIIVGVASVAALAVIFMIPVEYTKGLNNTPAALICALLMIVIIMFFASVYKLISETQEKDSKLKIVYWVVIAIACASAIALVILVPPKHVTNFNNTQYIITGGLAIFNMVVNIIANIIALTLFEIFKDKIKNFYVAPVVVMNILNILVSVAMIFSNAFINDKLAFYAITIIILYLTVENQDYKLVVEYTKTKEEAEAANKAKTEFLINMSHEMRTPMNTILGFGVSLLQDQTLTEEVARRDIKSISDASNNLMDLINNILDISKLDSGEVVVNNADYLLEGLIFELNSLIPSKITKEELRFTIDINHEIPKEYNGDAYKIFKIVSYVLINAIEYTNYGEVKLTIDGKKTDNNEFELLLLVSNSGHAMTTEIFNRGFDDFVKIENASQNNVDSIKLGLIIAKQLIDMLGGTIEFVNRKGEGTKYYIRIKQKIVNEEKIGNIFESGEGKVSSSKDIMNCAGLKVLIVDDSDINLKLASRYMSQFNFVVSTATSGKECIELVKQNDYDVIFIDHMMPEMDGVDTANNLQLLGKPLPPIVALTANNYEGIKEDFIKRGFANYLQKPLNFKDLSKVINEIFRKDN